MPRSKTPAPFPTKRQIQDFIRESPTPVGKREIARAFRIGGEDHVRLKEILRELKQGGEVERGGRRRLGAPGTLPEYAVLVIAGTDADGEVLARPQIWKADGPPPTIYMAPDRHGTPALGEGERVLARLSRQPDGTYTGRVVRRIAGPPQRILGIYEPTPEGGKLLSTDRRQRADCRIDRRDANGAEPGELVLAEVLHTHRYGAIQGKVVERIGHIDDPRAASLIAIHTHDIPTEFSRDAVAQADAARPAPLGARTDLRDIPLVTIDGADARDFDDAVWAEPDGDPQNPGGWHLVVAIADVAHYVRPGDALDQEARRRGNSVYFPDRVVPMLPENLSNNLCSLRPHEDRACMAVHLWIDAQGRKRRHRFVRGLMRSAARLTYEQVQAARDGAPDETTASLSDRVVRPLYGAYSALAEARRRRGTLDLDLPERRAVFGPDGRIARIEARARFDSHRLIEEFMILANVAAAETLEERRRPAMYRVHDAPDPAKIAALREFLETIELSLAKGQVIRPKMFTRLLEQAARTPHAEMVNELVLRSQAQAVYSPGNIGHFGLALTRYAHFTSPIRRYADLLVHRGLISGLKLGEGGLPTEAEEEFEEIGQQISATERRAAAAERDAMDRYTAAYLSDRIGQVLPGRISGVTRFGLFVTLSDSGADGLVPISTLGGDFWDHDESRHALVGRRSREIYQLGERVMVRLVEAEVATGGLLLALAESEQAAEGPSPWARGGRDKSEGGKGRAGRPVRRSESAKRKAGQPERSKPGKKRKTRTKPPRRPKTPQGGAGTSRRTRRR
ncbi:MAG TPA: ribonuclease R [Alphaproteobacteria bacterium]|nr:ribonuclease R [Alphaproteobacteria bacterium]